MPRSLNGKKLTAHEHEIWRRAYESARRNPEIDEPGGVATNAVKQYRRNRRKRLKRSLRGG